MFAFLESDSPTVRVIPIGIAGFSLRVCIQYIHFWVVLSDEQMNTTCLFFYTIEIDQQMSNGLRVEHLPDLNIQNLRSICLCNFCKMIKHTSLFSNITWTHRRHGIFNAEFPPSKVVDRNAVAPGEGPIPELISSIILFQSSFYSHFLRFFMWGV